MKLLEFKSRLGTSSGAVDIREEMLRNVPSMRVTASIIADGDGIVAGTASAKKEAERLGLSLSKAVKDGASIRKGDEILRFSGSPKQIVLAEETLVGLLAKPSGIATNARRFLTAVNGRPQIVCGAWKKMPSLFKEMIRDAISAGGASPRMVPGRFVYLDKNYLTLLGGIERSLAAVAHLEGHSKVVQVKGREGDVGSEACMAARCGADVVFIDTGNPADVTAVADRLLRQGLRRVVKIAFGGGVSLESIAELKKLDVDILDIGRQIVDAPLLDMRLEIVDTNGKRGNA
jgi:nicotinate-nucleotide pyrophosphorylase (carboxylating)